MSEQRRLNSRNAESVRDKIKVIKLIKRLQDHAFGEVEMTKTQVHAACFLINKITPNPPQQVEHSGTLTLEQLVASSFERADRSEDIPASDRPN